MPGVEVHLSAMDLDDETPTRGRRENPLAQATPIHSEPYAPISFPSTGDDVLAPSPVPEGFQSQARADHSPKALRGRTKSEFEGKRLEFVNRFNGPDWNHPNDRGPEIDGLLTQNKALVVSHPVNQVKVEVKPSVFFLIQVAIQYDPCVSNLLRGTFVDAYSIVDMLETEFRYPSKCIRVLADQVDQKSKKDRARWPTKDNIVRTMRKGMFAGHGYTGRKDRNGIYTEQGILPRDYDNIIPFDSNDDHQPKGVIDPDTVLLDYELNQCLVNNSTNGVKLTVMFDCCYSGGLSGPTPNIKDMSDLRSRQLFARQINTRKAEENGDVVDYAPGPGNLLDLPVKIELGSSDGIHARANTEQLPVDERVDGTKEFRAFPDDCEVISWCACNGSQLAREDGQGGWFTTVRRKDSDPVDAHQASSTIDLVKRDEFKQHNKLKESNKSDAPCVNNELIANDEPTAVRANPRKSVPGEDSLGQFPKAIDVPITNLTVFKSLVKGADHGRTDATGFPSGLLCSVELWIRSTNSGRQPVLGEEDKKNPMSGGRKCLLPQSLFTFKTGAFKLVLSNMDVWAPWLHFALINRSSKVARTSQKHFGVGGVTCYFSQFPLLFGPSEFSLEHRVPFAHGSSIRSMWCKYQPSCGAKRVFKLIPLTIRKYQMILSHSPFGFNHVLARQLRGPVCFKDPGSIRLGCTFDTPRSPMDNSMNQTDISLQSESFLPPDFRPVHYELTILTDLEKLTFSAVAVIHLDVKRDQTKRITFNLSKLSIHENMMRLTCNNPDSQPGHDVRVIMVDEEAERVSIETYTPMSKGSQVILRVPYEGNLSGDMIGYYKSSAPHNDGMRPYALTQFEPTNARQAFPCWDEPTVKTTYSILMISREDTIALSNMPATSEMSLVDFTSDVISLKSSVSYLQAGLADPRGWKVTVFDTTPPVRYFKSCIFNQLTPYFKMSSYLVAFANGHFEHLESSYLSPLSGTVRPLRIYATKDLISQAQFALDVKTKVLPIYEEMFEIEYTLPKLDTLVAHDVQGGAMENWGLITGRTSALLFDEDKSDLAGKMNVAATESHECAHMWFGNVVTMNSWSSLWLKEGFATIVGEIIVIDDIFPEWGIHSAFLTDHLEPALALDSQRSSHPINVDCPDGKLVNQIFDSLSYSKAASVLRMLSQFLGQEVFLKGTSAYLKERLYGNGDPKDLWNGISQAAGMDINSFMDNWVSQTGFPLLTVKEMPGGISVRQDRFLSTGDATEAENQTIWQVPIFLLSADSNGAPVIDKSVVLVGREMHVSLDTSKPWKLNAGTSGVYRVAYSPKQLAELSKEASRGDSIFSLEDRVGLVSDAMILARAGYGTTSGGLEVILGMRGQMDYILWDSIASHLSAVEKILWDEPREALANIRGFRRVNILMDCNPPQHLFSPMVGVLGYEFLNDESPKVHQLRTLAVTQCATAYDSSVVQELRSRFRRLLDTGDETAIPPDLQRVTYRMGVQHGTKREYEAVKQIASDAPTPTAKIAAM
ncbi:Aminopeptidase 2 mitochondrial [Ceratobasidium sp. 414]|nr:Aminopeptidase 2 mitochondrial [Ceratobasidium sp. 414]